MFTLKGIYIGKGCKYRKCLQEDCYYLLENKMPDDFFTPNVGISTIVGQNGAGKSSLLDVLFRMLNNIGFLCGTPDGIAGRQTTSCVERFQMMYGYEPADGIIDDELITQLTDILARKQG